MSRLWLLAFTAFLIVGTGQLARAQPLAINPSAAASDVRNPSSTNPAAAASDIRNPSAINPSAAASQIPQPSGLVSSRSRMPTILMPSIVEERIARPPRRSRAVQRSRRGRPAVRQAERRERPAKSRPRGSWHWREWPSRSRSVDSHGPPNEQPRRYRKPRRRAPGIGRHEGAAVRDALIGHQAVGQSMCWVSLGLPNP
jgi:hypothetical protein